MGGWVGVEIIRIKAVLSSTGLELELSLAIITRPVLNLNFLQKITRIPDKNDVS